MNAQGRFFISEAFLNPIVTVTLQGSSYNQHFTSPETGSRKLNLPHIIQLMRGGAWIQTQPLSSYPLFKVSHGAGNRSVQFERFSSRMVC